MYKSVQLNTSQMTGIQSGSARSARTFRSTPNPAVTTSTRNRTIWSTESEASKQSYTWAANSVHRREVSDASFRDAAHIRFKSFNSSSYGKSLLHLVESAIRDCRQVKWTLSFGQCVQLTSWSSGNVSIWQSYRDQSGERNSVRYTTELVS